MKVAGGERRRGASAGRRREDRARLPARGRLQALRLRLPRVRAGVAAPPRQPPAAARGAGDASRRCRSGCCATRRSCSGCCSTCRSTSRRCSATRGSTRLPGEGRAAAADVSVHADLGRGLLDRRGGLLARDPARRGRAVRPRRGSTRRTSTRRCSSRRGWASSRSRRCRTTRATTSRRAARARSPTTTRPRTTERRSTARCSATSSSRSTTSHSDRSFNEFHVIVCRNVMIYFERGLQERVFELFDESLTRLGILALGAKESLRTTRARGEVRRARRGRTDLSQGRTS